MKKLLLTLILISNLSAESFFNQSDKQLHMGFSALIGFGGMAIAKKEYGLTRSQAFWAGLGAALTVGLAKELYDSRSGGTGFSGGDMIANGIGGAAGASLTFVIYEF